MKNKTTTRQIMRTLNLFLFAISLLALSCNPTKNMAKNELSGTSWQLQSWTINDGQSTKASGEKATLTFEEGNKLGGNSGCNAFGGDYTMENKRLLCNPFATKRYCEEAADQENHIFMVLRQGAEILQTKDQLTLKSRGGELNYVSLTKEDIPNATALKREEPSTETKRYNGLFTYMADAAVFKSCEDGQMYSVEIGGGAYLAAEKAYSRYSKSGGEPAYMVVDASMVKNPEPEGRPYLMRIQKLVTASPEGRCPE